MHRFFAPALDPGDETTTLPLLEGDHLTRVLRLGAGDTVSVFDGRGREFLARVINATRGAVRVQLVSAVKPVAEPAVAITLVQAVLKADKMDDVVRDAVMLGVAAVQPVITKRTEVTVAALLRGARVDRWRRVALASVKQSGRAIVPQIRGPLTLDNYFAADLAVPALMLVEPGASADALSVSTLRGEPTPAEAAVLIGPEGGWAEEERTSAASHGARLVTLGGRILRADAAPVVAISVLQLIWGDL